MFVPVSPSGTGYDVQPVQPAGVGPHRVTERSYRVTQRLGVQPFQCGHGARSYGPVGSGWSLGSIARRYCEGRFSVLQENSNGIEV